MPSVDITPLQGGLLLLEGLLVCGLLSFLGWGLLDLWLARLVTPAEVVLLLGLIAGAAALLVGTITTPYYLPALASVLLVLALLRALPRRIQAHRQQALLQEDEARYREAIRQDPKNAAAHSYLARTLERVGRYEEAITSYQHSIELDAQANEDRRRLDILVRFLAEQHSDLERCPRCRGIQRHPADECPYCGCPLSHWGGCYEIVGKTGCKIGAALVLVGGFFALIFSVSHRSLALGAMLVAGIWLAGCHHLMRFARRHKQP